jgi:cellulose synthase/poly-beta-1,6-N-acetylglucosamine synthase-like glycosyltransferase
MQFATGELIVGTDADCIAPKNWLHTIAAFYEKEKPAFIAMPVAYKNCRSFIEIFQELDFMSLQGITGAAIQSKSYGMCNGANLAYEKSAFYAVNGFENIDEIASGDDMMLMHKITKMYPDKIAFLKSKEVIVETSAMPTIGRFFQQRIRWASKADKYDNNSITVVLFFLYFFHVWLLALLVYGLISWNVDAFCLLCLSIIVKTIAELVFFVPVARFFDKGKKLFLFPFAQPFHIIYTLVAGWLGKFGSYSWKGRQVR